MLVVGGQAGAGAGFNVVPGSAWFSIDRRFNPEEELDAGARAADRHDHRGGRRGRRRGRHRGAAAAALRQHGRKPTPPPQALARCVDAVEGAAPAFQLCPGVLDTRWYSQLGIPAFAYGGGRPRRSPTAPTSTSTRRRCAAARPSTRCSPRMSRDDCSSALLHSRESNALSNLTRAFLSTDPTESAGSPCHLTPRSRSAASKPRVSGSRLLPRHHEQQLL